MTNDILHPLTLSAGSHQKGSGKGCAMNVISWENGDTEITDFPECSDPFLSYLVQRLNDHYAHPETALLSAKDSLLVLELGHMTVGTGGLVDKVGLNRMKEIYAELCVEAIDTLWSEANRTKSIDLDFLIDTNSVWCGRDLREAAKNAKHFISYSFDMSLRSTQYEMVKKAIQSFKEKTGLKDVEVSIETTNKAIENMMVCTV